MNPVIADAIRQKRRLRFTYNGTARLAEPQCYGIGTRGTELLRVHQKNDSGHGDHLLPAVT
jgi:hypothetical protein